MTTPEPDAPIPDADTADALEQNIPVADDDDDDAYPRATDDDPDDTAVSPPPR